MLIDSCKVYVASGIVKLESLKDLNTMQTKGHLRDIINALPLYVTNF